MLILKRRVPDPPLKLRRVGPDARITSLTQEQMAHIVAVVGPPGAAGPAGPQGPPGAALSPFVFTQASAASSWTVNHNLGWKPQVTILTLGGVEVIADVVHSSDNQFVVTFNQPFSGQAIAR